jgi:hypothetical protein
VKEKRVRPTNSGVTRVKLGQAEPPSPSNPGYATTNKQTDTEKKNRRTIIKVTLDIGGFAFAGKKNTEKENRLTVSDKVIFRSPNNSSHLLTFSVLL